jgi:predicted DNA-binding WGR domain protein
MPIYKQQQKDSNKFWSYEITNDDPPTVQIKWGRIGLKGQEQTKTFANRAAMQVFIDKKVGEKMRKKYVLSDNKDMKKETEKAQTIGFQYTVPRIEYVAKKSGKLRILQRYDPKHHIYVEVRNSWTKEVKRILLNKTQSYYLGPVAIDMTDREILYDDLNQVLYDDQMVKNVRSLLVDLAKQVRQVVIKKFAALGARKLSILDDDDDLDTNFDSMPEVVSTVEEVVAPWTSKQVVNKFAALGKRVLDL